MAANIVQAVFFLIVISSALARTCYYCDSTKSRICAYGIFSFLYSSVDCNEAIRDSIWTSWIPQQCVTLVGHDKDDNEYIGRGCMPQGTCKVAAKALNFFGSLGGNVNDVSCFTCDTDKCNPANKITSFTFLGITLAVFVFLL